MDDVRAKLLPPGAPNPIVWCERCRRFHRYWTFTQEDYDRVIAEAAQQLAKRIDEQAVEAYLNSYPTTPKPPTRP